MGSLASLKRFVRRLTLMRGAHFTTPQATRHRGDVQNPVELPFSVTPSLERLREVQECLPAVHRLRLPASP